MQRLMTPLRICRVCGLEAHTEADLKLFKTDRSKPNRRNTICKRCDSKTSTERKCRTAELVAVFRDRSPDGIIKCHFCGEEVTKLDGQNGDSLCIHSLDEDHENWNPTNKVPTHLACHISYHNTLERNPKWKGDIASDRAKKRRGSYPKRA